MASRLMYNRPAILITSIQPRRRHLQTVAAVRPIWSRQSSTATRLLPVWVGRRSESTFMRAPTISRIHAGPPHSTWRRLVNSAVSAQMVQPTPHKLGWTGEKSPQARATFFDACALSLLLDGLRSSSQRRTRVTAPCFLSSHHQRTRERENGSIFPADHHAARWSSPKCLD